MTAPNPDQPWFAALRASVVLALFALSGTFLVALSQQLTDTRIHNNRQAVLLQQLTALIPTNVYDNALLDDQIFVYEPELLGTPHAVRVYRARLADQAVAVILTPVAPDGYNGAIRLLVAIDAAGRLLGVRVVSHQETPGLGDGIDRDRSPWIEQFSGHSLQTSAQKAWQVRRAGGQFDQLTGATISSQAVIRAVHNCLLYFAQEKARLFTQPTKVTLR